MRPTPNPNSPAFVLRPRFSGISWAVPAPRCRNWSCLPTIPKFGRNQHNLGRKANLDDFDQDGWAHLGSKSAKPGQNPQVRPTSRNSGQHRPNWVEIGPRSVDITPNLAEFARTLAPNQGAMLHHRCSTLRRLKLAMTASPRAPCPSGRYRVCHRGPPGAPRAPRGRGSRGCPRRGKARSRGRRALRRARRPAADACGASGGQLDPLKMETPKSGLEAKRTLWGLYGATLLNEAGATRVAGRTTGCTCSGLSIRN